MSATITNLSTARTAQSRGEPSVAKQQGLGAVEEKFVAEFRGKKLGAFGTRRLALRAIHNARKQECAARGIEYVAAEWPPIGGTQ